MTSIHRVGQAPGHARVGIQPCQPLELGAAPDTGHPHPRHHQFDAMFEQRQVTDAPRLAVVDRRGVLATAAAAARLPAPLTPEIGEEPNFYVLSTSFAWRYFFWLSPPVYRTIQIPLAESVI